MDIMDNPYYRFFLDSDLAMAVLNSEGFLTAANRQFEKLLSSLSVSSSKDNTLPRSIRDILGSRQTSLFWASLSPLLNREYRESDFETSLRFYSENKDTIHWYNIHSWLIDEDDDLSVGIIIEDRTDIRLEEKRLQDDREIAEKAMEAKTQFLANMSHEIRTPIQTIIGMTELLEDTALDHEQSEYSGQIKFSAEVLLSLINDILDFSKIESGKMELEHISFFLEQAIEQAVDMISLEAHKKGLEIATDIPGECSIIIRGDPDKFRQIIINLVKNAVKFTYKGGVTVQARMVKLENIQALQISVIDTGIGISKDTRSRLFTTFMQADASDTRRFGGSGLGLAISHNLVELMDGRIEMIPNENGGSIFRFTIPLELSGAESPPLPKIDKIGEQNILIVDDRVESREIIRSYLNDLGCPNVNTASSGEMALEIMRSAAAEGRPYSLCLLDMTMPVMDGWRLTSEIHNDNTINMADLILMVPRGQMNADMKMTLLKYLKAHINKPIRRRNLAETLSKVLDEFAELESIGESEEIRPENNSIKAQETAGQENNYLILVAEDHPINQKLFSMIIEKLGYRVILSMDGMDAIEKTMTNNPDLVFMDIQMPRMNGYEASEQLRKRSYTKPIIAITASILGDEQGKYQKAGINDILLKPFKQADIKKILAQWLPEKTNSPEPVQAETVQPDQNPDEIPDLYGPDDDEIFNIKDFRESFMDNDEIACSLLQRFIDRTEGQLDYILTVEKAQDWETARREAHTIKGAALIMGGRELGKASGRLELAYKNQDLQEMKDAYIPVKEAFDRYKTTAEEYLKQMQFRSTE